MDAYKTYTKMNFKTKISLIITQFLHCKHTIPAFTS